ISQEKRQKRRWETVDTSQGSVNIRSHSTIKIEIRTSHLSLLHFAISISFASALKPTGVNDNRIVAAWAQFASILPPVFARTDLQAICATVLCGVFTPACSH